MRAFLLLILLLPAACATPGDQSSAKLPSLRVGAAALAGGAPEAALNVARRQLATNRDNLAALLMEGQALTDMGQIPQAEASFRRAAHVSPAPAAAEFGLARVLLLTGRASEAETAFRSALSQQPSDSRALCDLGIAQDMQEHHAEAQKSYAAAIVVAPELDAARVNMGLSLALAGDSAKAVAVLSPLAAPPTAPPRVRQDLATALALSGDQAGAEKLLRRDLSAEQVPVAMAAYADLHAP